MKTEAAAVKRELVWPEIKDPQALIDFAKAEIAKNSPLNITNNSIDKNRLAQNETVAYLHPCQCWIQPDFVLLTLDTHPLNGQALLLLPDATKISREMWMKVEDTASPQIKRVLQRFARAHSGGLDSYFVQLGFGGSVCWSDIRHFDENKISLPLGLKLPYPYYPMPLQRQGIPGEAKIEFLVSEQGLVSDLKIKATHKEFEMAVRETACYWRFEPGVDLETRLPAATRIGLTVLFKVNDD